MGHGHAHQAIDHSKAPLGKAFAIAISLNLAFSGVEAMAGILGHSSALLADAVHNLSDVAGLVVAFLAFRFAGREPNEKYTFGFGRGTILAALLNGILLAAAVILVVVDAIARIKHPSEPNPLWMMSVATVGAAVNYFSSRAFGHSHDLNAEGAKLHLLADAGISVAVVVAGALVYVTHLSWIDPMVGLVVSVVIAVSTWRLLKDATSLAFDGVPSNIDRAEVMNYLVGLPGVAQVHDLHIWALSTTETAMTVHLVVDQPETFESIRYELDREMHERFDVEHLTVQIENKSGHACPHATHASPRI